MAQAPTYPPEVFWDIGQVRLKQLQATQMLLQAVLQAETPQPQTHSQMLRFTYQIMLAALTSLGA
jgi:hypothetical protein